MKADLSLLNTALQDGLCRLSPLPSSAQAVLGESLFNDNQRPQLWVVDHFQSLEKLADSWKTLYPDRCVLTLPPDNAGDMASQGERLQTLSAIQQGSVDCILTLAQCLEESFPQANINTSIQVGDSVDPDNLLKTLDEQGYILEVEVYEKGRASNLPTVR